MSSNSNKKNHQSQQGHGKNRPSQTVILGILTILVGSCDPGIQLVDKLGLIDNHDYLLNFSVHHQPYGNYISENTSPSESDQLELKYKDIVVKSPHTITYTFKNSGKKKIGSDNYINPLTISFPSGIKVIDYTLENVEKFLTPDDIRAEGSMVRIEHQASLFPNRSFGITIVVDNTLGENLEQYITKPSAELRDSRTDEIAQFYPDRDKARALVSICLIILTIIYILTFVYSQKQPKISYFPALNLKLARNAISLIIGLLVLVIFL